MKTPAQSAPLDSLEVALVHDWLTGFRGGERVLHEHATLFPRADLYTLVHVPGRTTRLIEARRIVTSPLSHVPGVSRHYRKLLPLFPWAVSRLAIEPCDLVLSSSHAVAKGVRPPAGALHVSYCFTPMRYVWDQREAYLGHGLRRVVATPLAAALRRWDRRTSGPERVHRFIAISHHVAARIRANYGRSASVIHPPVDVHRFAPAPDGPDEAYLLVGGFVPYKREDLVIEAFARSGRPLVVAGDGPSRARLAAAAPSNVRFLGPGRIDDAELARRYARARALIYPQEEDFGIVAVEAQAAGRPVIAFGRGGATETVRGLGSTEFEPTGLFFAEQTSESLNAALDRFEAEESAFDPAAIRAHAAGFSAERFRREMVDALVQALEEGPRV